MSTGNVMKTRRPDPAEVEYKQMRFLIMDRPTDATIDRFIEVRLKSTYFKVLSLAISFYPIAFRTAKTPKTPRWTNNHCKQTNKKQF